MAVETMSSATMDLEAELKRLTTHFNLEDIWAVGQALGFEDEALRKFQEEPTSSSGTVEQVLRTWMEQGEDGPKTMDMLKDNLIRLGFQSPETMAATEANMNETKGVPRKKKLGARKCFILAGLFFVSFIEVGSIRTLSLILDDLTYQFDVSTSYLAALYGVVSGIYTTLAFLNTQLLRRFSIRQLIIFGGVISSSGLIFASFTQTVVQVTGALIAFGAGYILVILPSFTCLNSYFPDRFEIATGVVTSGGSIGVMIMPWVFEIILDMYGWRGTVLLLGACQIHFIAIGGLLMPVKPVQTKTGPIKHTAPQYGVGGHENVSFKPDPPAIKENTNGNLQSDQELEMVSRKEEGPVLRHTRATEKSDDNSGIVTLKSCPVDTDVKMRNVNCLWRCLKKFFKISGLRIFKERPMMIIVCLQILLFSLPYATWLLFTIPNAQAKGLTGRRSAQISLAGGIANFFGRFASGFVVSKNVLRVEVWYLLANIMTAMAFVVNFFADPFWFLTILSVVFGFMFGFNIPTIFILVKKTVGEERYQSGLVLLNLCYGVAFPFAGFVAGKIYDGTGSYNVAFCIMGGLALAAGVAVIFPALGSRFGKILNKCACPCV